MIDGPIDENDLLDLNSQFSEVSHPFRAMSLYSLTYFDDIPEDTTPICTLIMDFEMGKEYFYQKYN